MKISETQITVKNGDKVIEQVCQSVAQGDLEIDFSQVQQIDSTALAVVLAAQRAARSNNSGKKLELVNPPAQLHSLIAAYGVQLLFP